MERKRLYPFHAVVLVGCLALAGDDLRGQEALDSRRPAAKKRVPQPRSWNDGLGLFPFKARLIGCADGVVRLRQTDRTYLKIPLDRLCALDQKYVREHLGELPPITADDASVDFPQERLRKQLFGPEDQAQQALLVLAREHTGDARARSLILEYIDRIDWRTTPRVSESIAIRLLEFDESPQATTALLQMLGFATRVAPSGYAVAVMSALKGHVSPEVGEAVVPLLESSDYRLVLLAVDLLAHHRHERAFDKIAALIERREFRTRFGFRQGVFRAIARYGDRRSVDFFVEQLPELDGELKKYAVDYLRQRTRQSIGGDAVKWREWLQQVDTQSLDYLLDTPMKEQVAEDYEWDYPVPEFYDHKIYAKHVIFIIDRSSSMTARLSRRRTRLDEAKRQLTKAIMALPTGATFNVVFFSRTVEALSSDPLEATPEEREWAVRFINALQPSGGTAIYGALDAAFLMDGNIEAFYLVSDGHPTVGVTNIQELLMQTATANTFRYIRINTVGIGEDLKLFLQALSEQNFGVYRHAR